MSHALEAIIDHLQSRLDALEAKPSTRTVSLAVGDTVYSETVAAGETIEYLSPDRGTMVRVQDGVATWMTNDADGKTKVETVEPATVARDALKQAVHDGFKNGLNVDDLVAKATGYYGVATAEYQKIRADLKAKVASDIPMMTPAEVDAYHHRDEPNVATIQDLFDTIAKQAATIEKLKVEKNGIYTKTKARKNKHAAMVSELNRRLGNTHQACDGLQSAYLRSQNEIATLNTEIATRDRLLDDQCQTIGKLEAERDAKTLRFEYTEGARQAEDAIRMLERKVQDRETTIEKLVAERDAPRSYPTTCGYEDITTAPVEVQKIYEEFLANVRKAGGK